jgi:hypothetical protein
VKTNQILFSQYFGVKALERNISRIATCCRAGFLVEASREFRVGGQIFGRDLDGYVAVKPGVVCAVDFAHSAGTQPRTNVILP